MGKYNLIGENVEIELELIIKNKIFYSFDIWSHTLMKETQISRWICQDFDWVNFNLMLNCHLNSL